MSNHSSQEELLKSLSACSQNTASSLLDIIREVKELKSQGVFTGMGHRQTTVPRVCDDPNEESRAVRLRTKL